MDASPQTLVWAIAVAVLCGCDNQPAATAPSDAVRVGDSSGLPRQVAAAGDPGLDVEILEFPGGKPVAGVEVRASHSLDAWAVEKTDECMSKPDAVYQSDSRGIVHVTCSREHLVLAARHGECWGRACFSTYDSTVRWLDLGPDRSLRVLVADAEGHPIAGVPVALRAIHEGWQHDCLVVSSGGADGIAVLPHAQYYMNTYETNRPIPNPQTRFAAALALPLGSPVQCDLPSAGVPQETTRLVLPPTGEVEVRCREADGTPARLELPVALRTPGAAEPTGGYSPPGHVIGTDTWSHAENGWVSRTLTGGAAGTSTQQLKDGRALFTHVALDQQLDAGIRRNYASTHIDKRFEGPKRVGERVVVELQASSGKAAFSGRVLRPDRTPLSNTELSLQEFDRPPAGGWDLPRDTFWFLEPSQVVVCPPMSLRTDPEGRFRFEFEPPSSPEGSIELSLTLDPLSSRALGVLVAPADCAPGLHDLGDIVIAPAPILFAGWIRDDTGRAVGGAEIRIGSVMQESWLWPHEPVDRSAPDGRYEIRSFNLYPSHSVALDVGARGHVRREREAPPEDHSQFDIVLPRTGRIHGHLLLPEDALRSSYGVTGTPAGGGYGETQLGASGEFTIEGLSPGLVHISAYVITNPGSTVDVAAVDAQVRPGEVTEVPPIDLRSAKPPR